MTNKKQTNQQGVRVQKQGKQELRKQLNTPKPRKKVHDRCRRPGNSLEKVQGAGPEIDSPRVENIVQEVDHEASGSDRADPEASRAEGSGGDAVQEVIHDSNDVQPMALKVVGDGDMQAGQDGVRQDQTAQRPLVQKKQDQMAAW